MKNEDAYAHNMAKVAMFDAYMASKEANPSSPKVAFTKQEVHDAVLAKFGEDWNSTKVANALSTLRYRNLLEAVGEAPRGHGGIGKLWCTIEIMEAETEPPEKLPEPESEPVKHTPLGDAIKAKSDEIGPMIEPVEIPAQVERNLSPETAALIAEVNAPEPEAFPTQQGKRKRKSHEPEAFETVRSGNVVATKDLVSTVHSIARQLGDVAKQLTDVQRNLREGATESHTVKSQISELTDALRSYTRSGGEMVAAFTKLSEDLESKRGADNDEVLKSFKSGFVEGWNACTMMRKSDEDLDIPVITQDSVKLTTAGVIVDGGETEDGRTDIRFLATDEDEVKGMIEALADLDKVSKERREKFRSRRIETGIPDASLQQLVGVVTARVDEMITQGRYVKHCKAQTGKLPPWAARIWNGFFADFSKGCKPGTAARLVAYAEQVEIHQVDESQAKLAICSRRDKFDFLVVGLDQPDKEIKTIPYPSIMA